MGALRSILLRNRRHLHINPKPPEWERCGAQIGIQNWLNKIERFKNTKTLRCSGNQPRQKIREGPERHRSQHFCDLLPPTTPLGVFNLILNTPTTTSSAWKRFLSTHAFVCLRFKSGSKIYENIRNLKIPNHFVAQESDAPKAPLGPCICAEREARCIKRAAR